MHTRIWSRKIVSVLRYFQHHPHCTLFGVTGDIDNLGVYVARNGRAKAEMLVDTYNRLIGSIYYDFIESKPHEFFETCFLPSGEEVFVLGVAADHTSAESLFDHLHTTNAAMIFAETSLNVGGTGITFGCNTFGNGSMFSAISALLTAIGDEDVTASNALYIELVGEIRSKLSIELDRKKFSSLGANKGDEILLRNIIYLKTLQYKEETRRLLISVQKKLRQSPEAKSVANSLLGDEYGLQDARAEEVLETLLNLLKE